MTRGTRRIGRGAAVALLAVSAGVAAPEAWAGVPPPVELIGLPGYELTNTADLNDRGTVVAVAGDAVTGATRALRWTADGTRAELDSGGFANSHAVALDERDNTYGWVGPRNRPARWDAEGRLTILGSLPGAEGGEVRAANERGQATGDADAGDGSTRAVRWERDGAVTLLEVPEGTRSSSSFSINDRGVVLGLVWWPGAEHDHSARWDENGRLTILSPLPGDRLATAYFVDNRGDAVGFSLDGSGVSRAVRWDEDGRVTALDTLGGPGSGAVDVNRSGVVVGTADATDGTRRAVRWDRRGRVEVLGGDHVVPVAVNDRGAVSGYALVGEGTRPLLWDRRGRTTELPLLPGGVSAVADNLNDTGTVTGVVETGDGRRLPVVWRVRG